MIRKEKNIFNYSVEQLEGLVSDEFFNCIASQLVSVYRKKLDNQNRECL
jgi:hypothetical protein